MKRLLSLCLLSMLVLSAGAQWKIGLKLAPQLTWASPDNKNTSSNGTRINAAYGLMADYFFAENYAIGTEFCVNSMGANVNVIKDKYSRVVYASKSYGHDSTGDVQRDYKMQYFSIPVLVKMRTKEEHGMRFYAEFGFNFSFQFKAKSDVVFGKESLSNVDVNAPDDIDNYLVINNSNQTLLNGTNTIRTSLIIGAGIQKTISGGSAIVAGIRYDNGMNSFMEDDKLSTSLHFIALNLGILF